MPGQRRIGFLAQEIQANLPEAISNLVVHDYSRGTPLLALEYSRLCTVLWCQCKQQQKQLQELTQRILALETTSSEDV
jgi:hypothetical protein